MTAFLKLRKHILVLPFKTSGTIFKLSLQHNNRILQRHNFVSDSTTKYRYNISKGSEQTAILYNDLRNTTFQGYEYVSRVYCHHHL